MILSCDEALIDMRPITAADDSACIAACPGGAVFYTAIALGRLGLPCGLATGLPSNLFGQQLTNALQESGVRKAAAAITSRPTTLAFVLLQNAEAFYDESTEGRMLVPQDLVDPRLEVTALFFGGISVVCKPAAEV